MATSPNAITYYGSPAAPVAAILHSALRLPIGWRAELARRLPSEARQQMVLSRKWGVYAVWASDAWAALHGRSATPPDATP